MNPELEALLGAFDAIMEAATKERARHCRDAYERMLQEILSRQPAGLSRANLHGAVVKRYPEWVRKKDRPAALPPKA